MLAIASLLVPKTAKHRVDESMTTHRHMIELAHGCNHMKCRCGADFCYQCGAEYCGNQAQCTCDLWEERMLLAEEERQRRQAVVHGSACPLSTPQLCYKLELKRWLVLQKIRSFHSTHPRAHLSVCASGPCIQA